MCDNSDCVLQSFIVVDNKKKNSFERSASETISPDNETDTECDINDTKSEKDYDFGSIISPIIDEIIDNKRKSYEKSRSTSSGSFGDIEIVQMEEAHEERNKLQDVTEMNRSSESGGEMRSNDRDSIRKEDETDSRVNMTDGNESGTNEEEIKSDGDRLEETDSKPDDTDHGSIKTEEIDNLHSNEEATKDELDFRVNVIERSESNDTWMINEIVEKDDTEIKSDNCRLEETDSKLDDTELGSIKTEEIDNLHSNEEATKDELDFRVNVIEKSESNDTWMINEIVEKDDTEIKSDNYLLEKTDVESDKIDYESLKSEEKVEINNSSMEKEDRELKDPEDNRVSGDSLTINDINKEQIDNSSLKEDKNELWNDSEICEHTRQQDTTDKSVSDDHIESPRIDTGEDNTTRVSQDVIPDNAEQTVPSEPADLLEKLSDIPTTESEEFLIVAAAANAIIPIISICIHSPKNFKSFNSVIGMLYNCTEFRDLLINYHHSDLIANIDFDVRQDVTVADALFVNDICKLFVVMVQSNETEIQHSARKVRKYFEDRHNQFDLYKGFNYLLEKINSVTKSKVTEINTFEDNCDISFFSYKCENRGFVNDLFYGQISIKTFCDHCKTVHHEQYEPINNLLLDLAMIQKNKESINLEECLQMFFSERQINSNNKVTCCPNLIIKEIREITHSPEYLFICLNRESANGEMDKRFVETDNGIIVPVRDQMVLYQLCAVIDCSHYNSLKCFSKFWWNIDNHSVRRILEFEILSNDSCGFLFKKQ